MSETGPYLRTDKQKTWYLFPLLSGGIDFFLIESELRHNSLMRQKKMPYILIMEAKAENFSQLLLSSTPLSFGLWKERVGRGTHGARTR